MFNLFRRLLSRWCVPSAPRLPWADVAWAGGGVFVGLSAVALLAAFSGQPWLLGSFGASCVLLFGFPNGPFSQPRNVIGGHFLCSLVGLLCLWLLGPSWWSLALAGAAAAMLMLFSQTTHPPAGSNPVIIFLSDPGWLFLLLPTLLGAVLLVVLATGYARLRQRYEAAHA
ncbi:MAG: HPP family protein [Neisseriaceae bacterium]|nr:HPP family protein [Neisseriaceae bacterium]